MRSRRSVLDTWIFTGILTEFIFEFHISHELLEVPFYFGRKMSWNQVIIGRTHSEWLGFFWQTQASSSILGDRGSRMLGLTTVVVWCAEQVTV